MRCWSELRKPPDGSTNWLAGICGPSGCHLILLAREADAIMATLLVLEGRELNVSALSLISLKARLVYAVNAIGEAIDSSAQPEAPPIALKCREARCASTAASSL